MRYPLLLGSSFLVAAVFAAAACGDSSGAGPGATDPGADAPVDPTKDGAQDTSDPQADGGKDVEQPLTVANEVEPNDGTPITAIGTMKLPGTMNGKIDPANDQDVFSIDVTPGELWDWTATPTTADLAPLITILDLAPKTLNPILIGYAPAGATGKRQHFVLRPGTFVATMRDARNRKPSQNMGGPTFGYALTGRRVAPQPIAVTFPSTKTGKLASNGAIDLYTFPGTATAGKGFDIVIKAQRKVPPSTLDSRLSLFDIPGKKTIITNDDSVGTTDSEVGSASPLPSTYMVIVDNEGTNDADLSYEILFTLRN